MIKIIFKLILIGIFSFLITGCSQNLQSITKDTENIITKQKIKLSSQNVDTKGLLNIDKKEKESVLNDFIKKESNISLWMNKNKSLPLYIINCSSDNLNNLNLGNNKSVKKVLQIKNNNYCKTISEQFYQPPEKLNTIVKNLIKDKKILNDSMIYTLSYNKEKNTIYGIKSVKYGNKNRNSYFYKLSNHKLELNKLIELSLKLSIPQYSTIVRSNKLVKNIPFLNYNIHSNNETIKNQYIHKIFGIKETLINQIDEIENSHEIFEGHEYTAFSVDISPNGKYAISGGIERELYLWDLENKKYWKLNGHRGVISSVKFYDNGKKAVTASYDNTVGFWDIENKKFIARIEAHSNDVNDIDISKDEKYLVSAGDDDRVLLWDIKTKQPLRKTLNITDEVNKVSFINDSYNYAAADEDNFIKFYNFNTPTGKRLKVKFDSNAIISNKNLLAIGQFKEILLFDTKTYNTIAILKGGHDSTIYALDISPDGRYLVSAGYDEKIVLWDLKKKTKIKTFKQIHESTIRAIKFSSDGKFILSADEKLIKWNIKHDKKTNEKLKTLKVALSNILQKEKTYHKSQNTTYQYILNKPLSQEDKELLINYGIINIKNNTYTLKDINQITKTLNYDFLDPIVTSVFNDSYQYFTNVKTEIDQENYSWEVTAPNIFNISELYFTSKYDLKQEDFN